jgi:hypothetical protein
MPTSVADNALTRFMRANSHTILSEAREDPFRPDKGEDGRRYVYLDDAPDVAWTEHQGSELTNELRNQLHYVERQLEAERQAHAEARRIIAGLWSVSPP